MPPSSLHNHSTEARQPGITVFHWLRRVVVLPILLLSALQVSAQQGGAAGRFDEGAVRASVLGLARQDLLAGFAGDTLFLPLAELCEFLQFELRTSVDLDSIMISTGGRPLSLLLPDAATFEGPNGRESIHEGDVSIIDERILVEAGLAQRLLGIAWQWNARRLELEITPDATLPIIVNARNQKRYASLKLSRARDNAASFPVDRPVLGDMTLNWSLSGVGVGQSLSGSGMMHLGGPFLSGSLDVRGGLSYQPKADRSVLPSIQGARWQYLLPGSALLNRIALEARQEQGGGVYSLELSNNPLPFRRDYIHDSVTGVTEPGWVVEMYSGGTLVSMQRTDSSGAYSFPVDLRYGGNMMEIQEVSPYGERRIRRADAIVRPALVPPGALDYSVLAGVADPSGDRRVIGHAKTRAGITSWLTVGADAMLRPSLAGRFGFDSLSTVAAADLWFGGSSYMNLRYSSIDGVIAARFSEQLSTGATVDVAVDQYQPATGLVRGSFFLGGPIGSWRTSLALRAGTRSGRADGDLMAGVSGHLWRFNLSAMSKISAESNTAGMGDSRTTWSHGGTSLQVMVPLFGSLLLRGRAEYIDQIARPDLLEIGASTYLFGGAYLTAGYVVDSMQWRTGKLQAQISLDLNPARLLLTSDYANGSAVSTASASGSMVIGPSGVIASSYGSIEQSTIIVVGFVDANGNGRRDGGERSLGRVEAALSSDGYPVADRSSLFAGLGSNMEYTLDIDLWSHVDDGLYPSRRRFSIYTLPATLHEIEIPFAAGYDVTGQSELELSNGQRRSSAASFNGLRIQLVETGNRSENSRQALYEGEMFQDGSIVITGVAAGEYRIEFDAEQLASRSLAISSLPDVVTISETERELPVIVFGSSSATRKQEHPN